MHFTSSDPLAALPGDQPLTNGTATLQVTLLSAGNQTITATDTLTAITGTSAAITVTVLTATHFAVTAPATALTGSAFNITVTAQDASNTPVGTYSGTVHFTSSDAQALLPGDLQVQSGTTTLQTTLNTAGNQTITATDTVTTSITGTSQTIAVMGATHFSVTAPANATAGSAFDFTVNALDAANTVIPAYAGTVRFSSSDNKADLPATQAMTSGTATFVAGLKTAGSQTITVTDTVTAITGTSPPIQVTAAVAANSVPFVAQPLSPDAVAPGAAGFPLTVNGTGFVPGATVKWNGNTRVTTFVNQSRLTAAILASDVVTPNTASVTVTKPGPGGGTSNVVFFEATLPTGAAAFGTSALSSQGSPALSTTSLSIICAERCVFPPDCGCVCTSKPPQPISLADFGNADLSITGITTTSPFTETNTCNSSLTAGNSCTVEIGVPDGTQTLTGALNINDNAPGSPQAVNLTGSSSCKKRP